VVGSETDMMHWFWAVQRHHGPTGGRHRPECWSGQAHRHGFSPRINGPDASRPCAQRQVPPEGAARRATGAASFLRGEAGDAMYPPAAQRIARWSVNRAMRRVGPRWTELGALPIRFWRSAAGERPAVTRLPGSQAPRSGGPVLSDPAAGGCEKPPRSLGFSGDINGLGPPARRPRGAVPACVDSPHPLSGGMPRMRAAPAVNWAGRVIRKDGHRFSEPIMLVLR